MIKQLTAIIAALTLATPTGCKQRPNPAIIQENFNINKIVELVEKEHGGVAECGCGREFDGDGVQDYFVEGKDGTIYATRSRDNGFSYHAYNDGKTRWYKHRRR